VDLSDATVGQLLLPVDDLKRATAYHRCIPARYVHTNLAARDAARLSAFYQDAFGCVPVVAGQVYSGAWVDALTGLAGAEINVTHLRLPGAPGAEADGPTLEIIQYNQPREGQPPATSRPGWGHIAFAVEDVAAARAAVLRAGGAPVGEVVTASLPGRGTITVAYVADPEGNIVELQRWAG
jgi:catechol 2,3-dioxygenase-like lactoylglutathione lyase family enzyme